VELMIGRVTIEAVLLRVVLQAPGSRSGPAAGWPSF